MCSLRDLPLEPPKVRGIGQSPLIYTASAAFRATENEPMTAYSHFLIENKLVIMEPGLG
jgi:hypothetical protein